MVNIYNYWINGPYTIKYKPTPTLNQSLNEDPFTHISKIKPKVNYTIVNNTDKTELTKRTKEPFVKSHRLFLLDTKKLTII
jgi:hypothetical protein